MKLAVFDCDGTLVDSQANILRAMHSSFMALGLPFAFILCAGLAGAMLQHKPL